MLIINLFKPSSSKIVAACVIFLVSMVFQFSCQPFETQGGAGVRGIGWHYPCGVLSQVLASGFSWLWINGFGLTLLFNLFISYIISSIILTVIQKKNNL